MSGNDAGGATWHCVATLRTSMSTNCLLQMSTNVDGGGGALLYGMYAHDSASGNRTGGMDVWPWAPHAANGVDDGRDDGATLRRGLSTLLPLPGVFDMAPQRRGGNRCTTGEDDGTTMLLVSCTDGTVKGVRYGSGTWDDDDDDGDSGRHGGRRGLDVAWSAAVDKEMVTSTTSLGSTATKLVCSAHLGNLSVLMPSGDGNGALEVVQQWQGHEFDAWCVAASCEDGDGAACVWSGGDDGCLALWDLRVQCARGDGDASPVVRRRFDAGVVTILSAADDAANAPCGLAPHQLLVGSYDEHLYVLDRRAMKRPVAEVHVGGGAWRCRPIPTGVGACDGGGGGGGGGGSGGAQQQFSFAVAAMQGGAAIVEWSPSTTTLEATASIHVEDDNVIGDDRHEGVLVYDCAAIDSRTVATCSFYNRAIKVWCRT